MKRVKEFTLIELMIVAAVIGILVSILMPSLNNAREAAKLTVCVSNMNQLSYAYLAYSAENDSKLISSSSSISNNMPAWIVHSSWDFDTNVLESPLWSYVKSKDIFRCPNESRQNIYTNGNYKRTYSINSFLNGNDFGIDPTKIINSLYRVDSTENTFLFIGEEDPRGCNINSFSVGSSSSWVDWPANNHGTKKIPLSFIDGHSEIYNFKNNSTSQISWFYSQAGADDRREFLKMATPQVD